MRAQSGFTLIELAVVLAIIAIAAAIAVPSYNRLIEGNQVTSATNELVGALKLARSEAATYGEATTLCSSDNQTSCGGSWADGIIVRRASGTVSLALPASNDISITGNEITFNRDGRLDQSETLTIHNDSGTREIQVTMVGQISTTDIIE